MTHEEAVQEVYKLTPQIREYDEFMYLGVRWLPYTMFFHHKNYKSEVINTDSLGFRYSNFKNTSVSIDNFPPNTPINLLVGGSTTLGTGATTDSHTISSCLANYTGEVWLNFGGRGYNSVQEVILFLMHQHRFTKIKNVVILSGLNTLALEGLPDHLATENGRYYYSYEFHHYMNKYNEDLKVRTHTYASMLDNNSKGLLSQVKNYFSSFLVEKENPADKVITFIGNKEDRINRAVTATVNSAYQWKQLLAPFNSNLTFILQPLAYWTKSSLNQYEKKVFDAIDNCPNNLWRLYGSILGQEVYQPYVTALREGCKQHKIEFRDMNSLFAHSSILNENIFIDRVHFNNRGYDEAARIILEAIN